MLLNQFTNTGYLVDGSIVDDKDGIWEWPLIHSREQPMNELKKIVAGNCILNNF